MEVKTYFRKGSKDKEFIKIVSLVSGALKTLHPSGRLKERLLPILREERYLGAAWQDGDELGNILGKNSGHRFDIYNWDKKVAIEIEESEVKYLWKDFVKLSIGSRKGRVQYAILICPMHYKGRNLKNQISFYSTALKISEFMADLLWMKNLVIIGYEKYR